MRNPVQEIITYCSTDGCEAQATQTVPVSVHAADDDTRSFCYACYSAYCIGVQHGRMITTPPGVVLVAINKAIEFCGNGDPDEAISEIDTALANSPSQQVESWLEKAKDECELGSLEKAEHLLMAARMDCQPNHLKT